MFADLPSDIIPLLLTDLSPKDAACVRCVCKEFKDNASHQDVDSSYKFKAIFEDMLSNKSIGNRSAHLDITFLNKSGQDLFTLKLVDKKFYYMIGNVMQMTFRFSTKSKPLFFRLVDRDAEDIQNIRLIGSNHLVRKYNRRLKSVIRS